MNDSAAAVVDVHHHVLPDFYVEALHRLGEGKSGGAALPEWSEEGDLAVMDRLGIGAAVLSVSSPGVYFGDPGFTRGMAGRLNEFLAGLVARHPHRFAALAILPLPDADAALAELAHALDTLRLDGVILQASYGRQYLGDPAFDPVFDELNRRRVPALLHPTTPPGSDVPALGNLPPFLVEFMFDTTRAVANLIYSGTLERCPDLPLIVAHAGGAAPYLAGRLATGAEIAPELAKRAPRGALAYLRGLRYDPTSSVSPFALRGLRALVGPERLLFGGDYPYMSESIIAREELGALRRDEAAFGPAELAAVLGGNARALFPRLATVGSD